VATIYLQLIQNRYMFRRGPFPNFVNYFCGLIPSYWFWCF